MSALGAALLAAAALRGAVEISDRTLLVWRNPVSGQGAVADLELTPTLGIGVRSRTWEIAGSFAPRLTLRDIGDAPQRYDVLQQARLAASWHDRRTSLSLYQEGSYGKERLVGLAVDADGRPRMDALPAVQIINYASSRTGLLARLTASRRWAFNLSTECAMSGGTDEASLAQLPFQTALRGSSGVEYAASRRDRITATLVATRAVFSNGAEDNLLQGTTSWRRALGRYTTSTLTGGVGWATSRIAEERLQHGSFVIRALEPSFYPVAEAAIAHRAPSGRIEFALIGRLSPVIDRLTGAVDERLEGITTLTWSPTRALAIQGQLGVAQSTAWNERGSVSLVYDGVTISYRASRIVELGAGARTAWMSTHGGDAPPLQWTAYAGVTLRAPPILF